MRLIVFYLVLLSSTVFFASSSPSMAELMESSRRMIQSNKLDLVNSKVEKKLLHLLLPLCSQVPRLRWRHPLLLFQLPLCPGGGELSARRPLHPGAPVLSRLLELHAFALRTVLRPCRKKHMVLRTSSKGTVLIPYIFSRFLSGWHILILR